MSASNKPSYTLWLNTTLLACAAFFICVLSGDIFGYSFCDYCWQDHFFKTGYLSSLSFLSDDQFRFRVFLTCFYISTALTYPILYGVLALLRNLKKEKVFDKANTRLMALVSICCFLICLVCFIGSIACYALSAISLIGLFIGLIVQCVRLVMDKAIDMRDELDLTV